MPSRKRDRSPSPVESDETPLTPPSHASPAKRARTRAAEAQAGDKRPASLTSFPAPMAKKAEPHPAPRRSKRKVEEVQEPVDAPTSQPTPRQKRVKKEDIKIESPPTQLPAQQEAVPAVDPLIELEILRRSVHEYFFTIRPEFKTEFEQTLNKHREALLPTSTPAASAPNVDATPVVSPPAQATSAPPTAPTSPILEPVEEAFAADDKVDNAEDTARIAAAAEAAEAGRLCLRRGSEDAAAHFQRARELDPDNVEALRYFDSRARAQRARKALEEDKFHQAVRAYTAAILVSPDERSLYLGRALASRQEGDWPSVIKDCQQALEMLREFQAQRLLAHAQYRLGKQLAAAGKLDEAEVSLAMAPMAYQHACEYLPANGAKAEALMKEATDAMLLLQSVRARQAKGRTTDSQARKPAPASTSTPPRAKRSDSKHKPATAPAAAADDDGLFSDPEAQAAYEHARNAMGSTPEDYAEHATGGSYGYQGRRQGNWEYFGHFGDAVPPERPTHNYYAVLGVKHDATASTIGSVYRRMALVHHPDKTGTEEAAEFLLAGVAREVLCDPVKRAEHDKALKHYKMA